MLAAAPHRGARHEVISLGDCALGIQDHDDGGDAGIAIGEGLAVAYCGVIDNLGELRREYVADAAAVEPAAILLAAVKRLGEEVARQLRGAYAVAFTDGRRLWCFRDHVGYQSVYHRHDERGAYLASEAKQVVAGAEIPLEPDLAAIERVYFRDTRGSLPAALRGVDRIGLASVLVCDGGSYRETRYWHPERVLETASLTADEIQERFDELMTQAAVRMVAGDDVVLLSGGVDSPAVAAFAAEPHRAISGRPLKAFSYVYPRFGSVDERRYTEEVAEYLDLELHVAEPSAKPLDDLDEWARLTDGPVPVTALSLYAESYRRVRELGGRTVLTGELAEFLMAFNDYVLPHLVARRRLGALAGQLRARRRAGTRISHLGREIVAPLVPAPVSTARARADPAGVPAWLDRRAVNEPFAASVGWIGRRWAARQLASFSGTSPSMAAEEICQQVCGVRVRRPWTDVDLWEFFLSLPAEVKHPPGPRKALVQRLLRGRVPDSILDRRDKTVFDESVLKTLDYETLGRWVRTSDYRLPGVDYDALNRRIEARDLSAVEFVWAKDLAHVHAFLSLF